jgi:hypothetical protein
LTLFDAREKVAIDEGGRHSAAAICIFAVAIVVYEGYNQDRAEIRRSKPDCEISAACVYAVRSKTLHPTTLGEALDAERAMDIACASFRDCLKREEAATDRAASGNSFDPNINPTVREFWRKEAEREKALQPKSH